MAKAERLILFDLARSAALLGMVLFHLRFDLVMFGLLPLEHMATPSFYWHARLVAGSFLALAGAALWLAHGAGLVWPAFWRREVRILAAAALVSAATFLSLPETWVFFGILHAIAAFSLLALPFLRLPASLTMAAGAAIMAGAYALPPFLQWNHPALRWLGLQDIPTATIDLEPLFPWFGPFLIGLGLARAFARHLPRLGPSRTLDRLAWPGRHSLSIYLLHQPVLIALIWALARTG